MFKKIAAIILNFGKSIIKTIETTFDRFNKNATGGTIQSLRQAITFEVSKPIELDILGDKTFEYIEQGRPAGSKLPPQGALLGWMRARGINLAAEFPIRRAIAENGIRPTPVIATSFVEVVDDFQKNAAPKILTSIANTIIEAIKKGFKFP
jgi:hypothetical protein